MSKSRFGNKPAEVVETPVEKTQEPTVETQPEVTETVAEPEPVAEKVTEDTPVEEQTETKEEPVADVAEAPVKSEEEILAEKLGINGVTDVRTGKKSFPSTPVMRAYAERLKELESEKVTEPLSLKAKVKEEYGEVVAGNTFVNYVVTTLEDYVVNMSPKRVVNEKLGGEYQTKLARMYDRVLAEEPELSQICLNIIVTAIKAELNETFSAYNALRFANTVALNTEDALRFQTLTGLFIALAEGTPKSQLDTVVSVKKLLDYTPERNAKTNISEFIS